MRFPNVLVGEDVRRLGVESTVGDLRRDVVPRHVGPVAFTLDGMTYEIDLSTKNANKLRAAGSKPDGTSGDGAEARSSAQAGQR